MLEGTAGQESELKAQGVVEAAQDPNTSVTGRQAQEALLQQAKASGAAAFSIDPNASAEERAAQVKEKAEELGRPHRKHVTAALVSDQDDGQTAGYDLPEPSKAGALAIGPDSANGQIDAIKDEYAGVGWAPRFGNPGDKDDGGTMLDHSTFLEGKLEDKFFGDWYHNTGVIIFACLASWTVAVLGGGLAWVFIIMAICGTYYRTSIRRVRRNFRDDITRELSKNRLENDTESLEWMNSFMNKIWPICAPVLCASVQQTVDQVLSTSTPPFLESLKMTYFTLGTKPPRMEHVKTYPQEADDIVMMDWRFSFTPNDVADLTQTQIKNKVNPKVILEVRIGKAMISKGLNIIVEDMACSGIMRVKMKLQLAYPFVDRVEICFLERPTFDYVCKPLGGETLGFDINFMPGLEGFIQEQVHANLAPMLYAPNVFPIEVAKMLSGNAVDQAIGVLQITFHGAQGLKNPDKFSGTPDPYAVVSIAGRESLGKTKTVEQNANPRWNETVNVVLTSLREPLQIAVFDYNEFRKDKELGVCTFNLEQLETDQEHENQHLEVMAGGRARGVLQCDIRFFPVLEGQKLQDGTIAPPPESSTGIAKFTIEQAKDLDGTKSMVGQLNPYAVLLLNGKEIQISKKMKKTNNPIWPDATKELLITDRKKAKLGLVIKDDRDLAADPIIGTYQIKLDDMIELMAKGQEWYSLAGVKSGRAKMMLQWKPVALKGALGGSGGYITPIGVMRFHFKSGKDLKNLDTVGKSDPYARVSLSGIQKGRTVTFKNNLSPEWDEVFYVPVHTTREKLVVEVMDEENVGKDRTMGQIEIATSDYVEQGQDGEYLVHDSKDQLITRQLRIGTGAPKGTLNFTVAFYPTIPTIDPEDEEDEPKKGSLDVPRQSIEVNGVAGRARSDTAGTNVSLKTASAANSERALQKVLAAGEQEQTETDDVQTTVAPKLRITADDLSRYESGLIVFKIIDGDFAHTNCYLQVLMDDMLYPAYTSAKAKSRQQTFNETGDAVVRELDLSRITIRLVSETQKGEENGDEHVEAKLTGPVIDTLRRALYTPTQLSLRGKDGRESKVTVSLRFIPLRMQLDPSESFNNSGNLRIEVLDAADLPAADRNGFSDPFCKFKLNGKDVYKTKTQKKTLHPAWNEFFEVPVRSRTAANFTVDVYDWDFGDKADHLGFAPIDLTILEPFQAQEVTLALDGKSGAVRLKLLFRSEYVVRSRQGSSTFSGTFSAPGKVIGAPVKGVGKGAVLVGGGVGKAAGFLGRGFKRRTASHTEGAVTENGNGGIVDMRETSMDFGGPPRTPNGHLPTVSIDGTSSPPATAGGAKDLPATPSSMHNRQQSFGAMSQSPAVAEPGTASISILSAKGFGEDKIEVIVSQEGPKGPNQIIKTKAAKPTKTGDVVFSEGEDTKRVSCSAADAFKISVREHKTFGTGDELGEATFYVADQGSVGAQTKEIPVGKGVIFMKSSFQPAEAGSMMDSPKGKHLGRFMSRRERSVTPSASG